VEYAELPASASKPFLFRTYGGPVREFDMRVPRSMLERTCRSGRRKRLGHPWLIVEARLQGERRPTELRDRAIRIAETSFRSSPKGPKSAGKSAARSGPCLCKRMRATTCVFGGRILRLAAVMRHRIC
jgi:hypothetical protein